MQVSVEKISELSRKMTVSVPETVVQEKMAERLKALARQVKIDGFRPGKVPQHVVNKMYGDKVRGEVAGDLIQSTYYDALRDQDLKPAGQPNIRDLDETEGFQYIAEFEVYPEISLAGIEGLEITKTTATVEESDVDTVIEKLRAQKKTWNEVERASQENDRISIAFSGISEGENFTDGTVKDFPVEIGAKQMIPGFEDNLVGLKKGESKTFSVTFPEGYSNAKLAGKPAEFSVEVIKVEEAALPVVDEDFIKGYGTQGGSMATFRTDIKANMERELVQALHGRLKNAVLDALYEKVQLVVPNALVDEEIQNLMKPYLESAKRNKLKQTDVQLPKEMFQDQAQRRVALGLILGEIIHAQEIKVDDNKVRSTIEDMAKSYEQPEAYVSWYYSDKSRLHSVQQMVLEDQTVEWLVSKAKIANETMSFSDIMDANQR
ncbi:trigger factor Tig [Methyloglobulus morosus KoM1]|uniref:Trigger factor n=1 Tax=Methyloglobulus morosus KoM1 TaxID=1116472 RepID=V5C3J6_9GAMM|nr:trigger factor [Methyloglobulus morosus]ESS71393.1 trigger factor Tig [Methyloglobulus morosus KoM1]